MPKVEVRCRLIEQDRLRFLSQSPRQKHPLTLARADLLDRAVGEMQTVGGLHRLDGLLTVLFGIKKRCAKRQPPHRHNLAYGKRKVAALLLRHVGDGLGKLPYAEMAQVFAVGFQRSAKHRQNPAKRFQERRFSAAVLAQQGDDLAGLNIEINSAENRLAVIATGEIAY